MFCPKCGTQNPENGKFCRSCGADLGNVSAALSGNLPKAETLVDRKGKPVNWESAITKLFMGAAFLIISIVLAFTRMGEKWWFWMLIPAFIMLGSGIAQYIQLKKLEQQNPYLTGQHGQNTISAAPANAALPPTHTDYVSPSVSHRSIYDTGELVTPQPGSVIEGTTRHLEVNSEGETMTLPKK